MRLRPEADTVRGEERWHWVGIGMLAAPALRGQGFQHVLNGQVVCRELVEIGRDGAVVGAHPASQVGRARV